MTQRTDFSSVLVANRGEIALRVMRTARAEGLECIAVYSQADADAPHVGFADRAVCIGPGPAEDSYLSIGRILDAARRTGAGAIHPGYGFLSENAAFARACAGAGLVFIGPPPEAIALMGDKAAARRRMAAAGVPCLPGYDGADQSAAALAAAAGRIGFPVMIKAAAGGGGRGMRPVAQAGAFADALRLARAEALSAFGSERVIVEKALARPRHVEIQIFADRHGNVVHLGERDCSVQRRHQKVIEEAPGPAVTRDLRARMGAAAAEAARAIGYEGAGTVEFLLDESGAFHFLEMNTRLQVEHPVTELITGRDLVALQLAVARGAPLGFAQEDVALTGHAIEARLYAEDPTNGFLPAAGDVALWHPAAGPGIRIDHGIATAQRVPPFYDPMLAKIVAHGATREEARKRLLAALGDSVLFGVATNRDFLIALLDRPGFVAGAATTAFIAEEFGRNGAGTQALCGTDIALAAALTYRALQARAAGRALLAPAALLGWSSTGTLTTRLQFDDRGQTHDLRLRESRDGGLSVSDGARRYRITGADEHIRVNGVRADLRASLYAQGTIHVATGRKCFCLKRARAESGLRTAPGAGMVTAPMHGRLREVLVAEGDRVDPGTRLAILEAMKLQHEVSAPAAGRVRAVRAGADTQVRAGDPLIEIEIDGSG